MIGSKMRTPHSKGNGAGVIWEPGQYQNTEVELGLLQQAPHEAMGLAMQTSFQNWGKKNPKYKKTYKKLNQEGHKIANAALSELEVYLPAYYDLWWTYEHMRFFKIHGDQLRLVHELMYKFLEDLHYGRLDFDAKKKSRQATDRV